MELRLYQPITNQRETFVPIDSNRVRMYACGPTVYDYVHVGNARMLVVFDVLFRVLRLLYGESSVEYVRNITDVDDKIIERAAELGVSASDLTRQTTVAFKRDAADLGCLSPTVEPLATDHVPDMIRLIEILIVKGHAYESGSHVLFSVPSFSRYGMLSGLERDVAMDALEYKRDARDFVLWKPAGNVEPAWDSPWGKGRPGWHVECSAMAHKYLGSKFDVHGGGADLLFPHHENETAQSCCAFDTNALANYWVHNGQLRLNSKKMSKSDGNFVTVRDLLHTKSFGGRSWSAAAVRLVLLGTQYRRPLDFSVQALVEAEKTITKWRSAASRPVAYDVRDYPVGVTTLLEDLNVPGTYALLHEWSTSRHDESRQSLWWMMQFLGFYDTAETLVRVDEPPYVDSAEIDSLVAARCTARLRGDWDEADRLRAILETKRVVVTDFPHGVSTWKLREAR